MMTTPHRKAMFARIAICILLLCAGVSAQSRAAEGPTPSEIAQSGERSGSTYRNRLLKFSLSIPQEWTFASEEMNKTILSEGNKKIKVNESESKQKQFDKSIANTAVLFTLSKYDMSDARNRAFMTTGYENTPDDITARAYTDYNKQLAVTKGTSGKLIRDTYQMRVGGKDVFAFDIESMPNGIKVSQRYHILAHRGGMLFFIITWLDGGDEGRLAIERVINSAKFES